MKCKREPRRQIALSFNTDHSAYANCVLKCWSLTFPSWQLRLWFAAKSAMCLVRFRMAVTHSGRLVEWHLVLFKSFEDITFDFVPRLHHAIVFLLPAFSHARFKAIGAVGDPMSGDGIEQLFV